MSVGRGALVALDVVEFLGDGEALAPAMPQRSHHAASPRVPCSVIAFHSESSRAWERYFATFITVPAFQSTQ